MVWYTVHYLKTRNFFCLMFLEHETKTVPAAEKISQPAYWYYLKLNPTKLSCITIHTTGNIPKEASFAMHGILANHYLYGASYPRGGSSEIALHIIPVIEKPGGKVLVRAKVTQILLDEDSGKATGKNTPNLSTLLYNTCMYCKYTLSLLQMNFTQSRKLPNSTVK